MARIQAKTAVERCREKYPSMSQAVYSMARNPEKYGIRLTPEARYLAGLPSTREIEKNRAKRNRLVCRVGDRVYASLANKKGDRSWQEFIEYTLLRYWNVKEEDINADL